MTKHSQLARRVRLLLLDMLTIDLDQLEELVAAAHECDIQSIEDPPQPFAVTRQALRMFWHFRCNLEAVAITTEQRSDDQ